MCGIVGYVGPKQAYDYLIEGLFRLEYRGYDSAGVALQNGEKIGIRKKTGRVSQLAEMCKKDPIKGSTGIGHTRAGPHMANRAGHQFAPAYRRKWRSGSRPQRRH